MEIKCFGYNRYDLEEYVEIRDAILKECKEGQSVVLLTDQQEDDLEFYRSNGVNVENILQNYSPVNELAGKNNKELYLIKTKHKEIKMFMEITSKIRLKIEKVVVAVEDVYLRTPEDDYDKDAIAWYGHNEFRKLLELLYSDSKLRNYGLILGYTAKELEGQVTYNRCKRTNPDNVEFLDIKYKNIKIEKKWYFSSSGKLVFGDHRNADLNLKENIESARVAGELKPNEQFADFIEIIKTLDKEGLEDLKKEYERLVEHWTMNCAVSEHYAVPRKEGDCFDKVKFFERCYNHIKLLLKEGKSFKTLKNIM